MANAKTELSTERIALSIDCAWSNIGQEWCAEATHDHTHASVAFGKGKTRPEALRELADELERIG